MANPFDKELMAELLQREIAKEQNPHRIRFPKKESASSVDPLSPTLVSLLGGLADSGSTYAFLKRGTAKEDNKLVAGLSKNPEALTALGVATNVALPFLLKKLGKKFPKVANAVAANQGALQMGYGAINTQNTMNPRVNPKSEGQKTSTRYSAAIQSELAKRQR